MEQIAQLTESIAAQAIVAGVDDLQALAGLHTQLQSLGSMADSALLRDSALKMEKLVERVILRDVEDPEVALKDLAKGVAELQGIVSGAIAPPQTPSQSSTPSTPCAPHAVPQTAQTLNGDDLPLVQEFIGEARSHIETAEGVILKLEENPEDIEAINAIFRSFHTIKGVAGFMNLGQIGALAHSAENLLDLARQGKLRLSGGSIDAILAAIDVMKALVNRVASAAAGDRVVQPDSTLDALLSRLGAVASGQAPVETSNTPAPKASAAETTTQTTAAPAEATVKVATDRLDALINMVGELVIAQAMVAQDSKALLQENHRLARDLSHLGKITRELQELSMSMRMVPIHGVFQKMARLVRDLGRKQEKELELSLVGGETELDRNLVEAITDPLIHMVRNAADHGVEMPGDREQLGKPRAGKIELKAYHHSGNIVIEITDDGKGLNKAKILKKAVAAGIIGEGQQLSEQEIFKLIFHAGLSTAEKVTDVSGRGVGMDVVRKNVEALRGRIEIASTEGQGSKFTIRLPLTLAVIDGLVVRIGAQRFIIPILSVEQSVRPLPEQLSSVQGRGEMCLVRERLLPLYRLHRTLNIAGAKEDPTQALVVIVQDDARRCCLLVDELLGQQQVVIKSLGDGIGKVRGVSGGAILGDGNVSLILDVPGLMDVACH